MDFRHHAAVRFYLLEEQIVIAPGYICKALHLHLMKKILTRSAQFIKPVRSLLPFMLVAWEMGEENT